MISVERGAFVAAGLPPGFRAYVDADWVPDGHEGPVPAVVVSSDGVAAAILEDVAARAAQAVAGASSTVVLGHGAVASVIRDLVAHEGGQPTAVVDASGSPQLIAEATRQLADGGVLVLAGESVGRRLDLDLYPDVHSRGLRIIGIPLRRDVAPAGEVASVLDAPAELEPGAPIPRSARWYSVGPP